VMKAPSLFRMKLLPSGLGASFEASAVRPRRKLQPVPMSMDSNRHTMRLHQMHNCLPSSFLISCRTYTTSYTGSLQLPERPADAAAQSGAAAAAAPEWQQSVDGPDMSLLTARDPILFFAEVPLYESELDDNGTSQLSVKVRA